MSALVLSGVILLAVAVVMARYHHYRESIRPDTPAEAEEAAFWRSLNNGRSSKERIAQN